MRMVKIQCKLGSITKIKRVNDILSFVYFKLCVIVLSSIFRLIH